MRQAIFLEILGVVWRWHDVARLQHPRAWCATLAIVLGALLMGMQFERTIWNPVLIVGTKLTVSVEVKCAMERVNEVKDTMLGGGFRLRLEGEVFGVTFFQPFGVTYREAAVNVCSIERCFVCFWARDIYTAP